MNAEELKKALDLHGKWLRNEDGGERADLSGAKLSGADLSGADLSGADLSGAKLSGANLTFANLSRAYLYGADLTFANLSRAYLYGADLTFANLSDAYGGNSRMECLQIDPYKIVILDKSIVWGGCTKKPVKDWLDYDGKGLIDSDKSYLETITKPFIRMCLSRSA